MEAGQKEALQSEFPHIRSKILMITELIGESYDIADPHGKDTQYFEKLSTELENIIEGGINHILRLVFAAFFER
jgi:hypothetical protein